jgi:hypothetical protein
MKQASRRQMRHSIKKRNRNWRKQLTISFYFVVRSCRTYLLWLGFFHQVERTNIASEMYQKKNMQAHVASINWSVRKRTWSLLDSEFGLKPDQVDAWHAVTRFALPKKEKEKEKEKKNWRMALSPDPSSLFICINIYEFQTNDKLTNHCSTNTIYNYQSTCSLLSLSLSLWWGTEWWGNRAWKLHFWAIMAWQITKRGVGARLCGSFLHF